MKTSISGREIESEDFVDLPNWQPLVMSIDGSDWLRPDQVTYLDYRQHLDLKQGVLSRALRLRDEAGRVSRWEEKRILSMHDQHWVSSHLVDMDVGVLSRGWHGDACRGHIMWRRSSSSWWASARWTGQSGSTSSSWLSKDAPRKQGGSGA